ncbi:MAG: (d)CMP kinase [Bacteroidetes bacterium]|nr:(d)CMP kinase [Bacteroidota bacterium]
MRPLVIAIDGPAASGKSTTARLVANALGYLHIDTGAMYRAVTLAVLRRGVDPSSADAVVQVAQSVRVELIPAPDGSHVLLDGEEVSSAIRKPEVTANVSAVSSYQPVRDLMVDLQRRLSAGGGAVLEGRDIGTVVLPQADLKIYMVANVSARAQRRQRDLAAAGIDADETALVHDIQERDRKDSTRLASPLRKAPDAMEVDTSDLTIEQQVQLIVQKANAILKGRA